MGTGVEVIGTGSDEIVTMSPDNNWVLSGGWDRAVNERDKRMYIIEVAIINNQSFDVIPMYIHIIPHVINTHTNK